jgi:putative oxidoreductase
MLKKLLAPHVDLAPLVLRLTLAVIFIMAGYPKLMQQFPWTDQLSPGVQTAVAWGEFVCGVALVVGLMSRVAAVGVIVIMAGAIALVTGGADLMPIAFGPGQERVTYKGAGEALNLALIGMALAVILLGSGKCSLDYLLLRWFTCKGKAPAGPPAVPLPEKVTAG